MKEPIVLYWHKRDFRLTDNEALHVASSFGVQVYSFYLYEPFLQQSYERSIFHETAISSSLKDLTQQYLQRQGFLHIHKVDTISFLKAVQKDFKIIALVSHQEHGTIRTFGRDLAVLNYATEHGFTWHDLPQFGVFRALKNHNRKSALRNTFLAQQAFKNPHKLSSAAVPILPEVPILRPERQAIQLVSQTQAELDLESFLTNRSTRYLGGISSPNTALTAGSRLSTHLAYGTISYRTVYRAVKNKRFQLERIESTPANRRHAFGLKHFTSRLHWHDHFIQRLEDFPELEILAVHPSYRSLPYLSEGDMYEKLFNAFFSGHTGEPMIDACMRCLNETGFINFRMRAMLVSYAIFTLHLDWRKIGCTLAERFTDFEPGIHWSQIQMQAGLMGFNALRVYDPRKQLIDQDPEGTFVKAWIPELQNIPFAQLLHYRSRVFSTFGSTYPKPIVDFTSQTEQYKALIMRVRNSATAEQYVPRLLEKYGSMLRRRYYTYQQKQVTKKQSTANKQLLLFDR